MQRRVSVALVTVAATVVGFIGGGQAAYAADRATIANSHPEWAIPANKVSNSDPNQRITFRVSLPMRDFAGAEAAATAISTKGTSSFRNYLTPDQVRQRYAPTEASVSRLKQWLTSSGFTVGSVPANNLYVEASGTVAAVQDAFQVQLGQYRSGTRTLRAPDRNLTVPADIATLVSAVANVAQSQSLTRPTHVGAGDEVSASAARRAQGNSQPAVAPPPDGFRNAPPCSEYWAQKLDTTDPAYGGGFPNPMPYAPCGYKPTQLRSGYGLQSLANAGLDGRGTTVAIVDAYASPTLYADAAEYARRNDPQHPLRKGQFSELIFPEEDPALEAPDQCDASGWYGEQSLDVEAVHAMAPEAHILYVGGSDCLDTSLDTALNAVVAGNLAQIVSNSYGDLGEDVAPELVAEFESIAVQAVLQGIGVYFSSGDSGDEVDNLGFASPDFSASSPWVTAVGGTSVGIDRNGRRVLETGWETGRSKLTGGAWVPDAPGAFLYGSGGGTSRLFTEPFYQRGVVPDALAIQNQEPGKRGRVVPDISMVGDPNTGMLIGITQNFGADGIHYGEYRIGGTSLSSPLFAGMMAVADQLIRGRHGFINPWMYRITSATGAIRDTVHENGAVVRVDYVNGLNTADGLSTTVRTFDYPKLTIHTTRGYDNVTGLGTPNGPLFIFLI